MIHTGPSWRSVGGGGIQSFGVGPVPPLPPTYIGPADVLPGWVAFWGLRAATHINVGVPLIRVVNSASTQRDIYSLANGALDLLTLQSHLGGLNGSVQTFYDQIGSNHLTQVTSTRQATITPAGVVTFNGTTHVYPSVASVNQPQPFLLSLMFALITLPQSTTIAKIASGQNLATNYASTASPVYTDLLAADASGNGCYWFYYGNEGYLFEANKPCAVHLNYNSDSSVFGVDGVTYACNTLSSTVGAAGPTFDGITASGTVYLGGDGASSYTPMQFFEFGICNSATFGPSQLPALAYNQNAAWLTTKHLTAWDQAYGGGPYWANDIWWGIGRDTEFGPFIADVSFAPGATFPQFPITILYQSPYKGLISQLGTITGTVAMWAPGYPGNNYTTAPVNGGSGYVNGTYTNVPLTGGTGTGATANFTVATVNSVVGVVTACTINATGASPWYTIGDTLGVSNANLGGTGSGFSIQVVMTAWNSYPWGQGSLVWGDDGNTAFVPRIVATRIVDLATLTSTYQLEATYTDNWTYDFFYDGFLLDTPVREPTSTQVLEFSVQAWLASGTYSYVLANPYPNATNPLIFTDAYGHSWKINQNIFTTPYEYTFVPLEGNIQLARTIDIKAMLNFLVANAVPTNIPSWPNLNGLEYWTGASVGAEAVTGNAIFKLDALSYNYAYNQPIAMPAGWQAFWGLRGLTTTPTKAINVRRTDNAQTRDINTLSNQSLDVATLTSFLSSPTTTGTVTRIYDQTGNGLDLVQGTVANQATISISPLKLVFDGIASSYTVIAPFAPFNPPLAYLYCGTMRGMPGATLISTPYENMSLDAVGVSPITVTANNQTINGLVIVANGGNAITANGFSGVTISNCLILHKKGIGISATNCASLSIHNCNIINTGAPKAGANSDANQYNISLSACNNATINNVRLQDGSSGVYVELSDSVLIENIEGHNQRGPDPRGQLVQFNQCTHGTLQDFSTYNNLNVCWTEDNVNVFNSTNTLIQRGLIDGNNSPSGVGVLFENGSTGSVNNVDVLDWSNGAFSTVGCANVTFTTCRCANSYTPCSQGRGAPTSNSLAYGSYSGASGTIFSACLWFNLVNPLNIIFDPNTCTTVNITQQTFTPRSSTAASISTFPDAWRAADNFAGTDWYALGNAGGALAANRPYALTFGYNGASSFMGVNGACNLVNTMSASGAHGAPTLKTFPLYPSIYLGWDGIGNFTALDFYEGGIFGQITESQAAAAAYTQIAFWAGATYTLDQINEVYGGGNWSAANLVSATGYTTLTTAIQTANIPTIPDGSVVTWNMAGAGGSGVLANPGVIYGGYFNPSIPVGGVLFAFSPFAFNPSSGNYAGINLRATFAPSYYAIITGSHIVLKLQFTSGTTSDAVITSCYVGFQASGSAFDGGQVPVTFGGHGSVTLSGGSQLLVSDSIAFAFTQPDLLKTLMVAIHFTGTTVNFGSTTGSDLHYYLIGADDSSVTAPAGFTQSSSTGPYLVAEVDLT